MNKKNLLRFALVTALILLIPLIAMQFTDEVVWTAFDFVFAGTLLFGTGLAYEFLSSRSGTLTYRFASGLAVITGLLLIWVNAAVGLIGSEDNPLNLLYFGVILIGIIGAVGARLKPLGMSHTLFATAVAQILVPIIALIVRKPDFSPGIIHVLILNAIFAALWLGSGLLFRRAANTQ
ncbi:MAG: hypothetical protein V4526_01730 [Patescibacteria group bacterium]